MTRSHQNLIAKATSYFQAVDGFDTDAILAHMTDTVVLEVPTHGVRKDGIAAVRETYLNRAGTVKESWHGDFQFFPNEALDQLAIRLNVKRTTVEGAYEEMDNLTLLRFDGDLISGVIVWMAGNNSLT